MLILTRKINEKIIINNSIEVVVLGIEDNNVKIGINAPSDVKVYREEIYNKICDENVTAHKNSPEDLETISNLVNEIPSSPSPENIGFEQF